VSDAIGPWVTILAWERFASADPEIVITLKREWRRYQAEEALDIYGERQWRTGSGSLAASLGNYIPLLEWLWVRP
jgi:hypothetical protein